LRFRRPHTTVNNNDTMAFGWHIFFFPRTAETREIALVHFPGDFRLITRAAAEKNVSVRQNNFIPRDIKNNVDEETTTRYCSIQNTFQIC